MRMLSVLNGNIESRLARYKKLKSMGYKNGRCAGPYKFNFSSNDEERMFYLGSTFQPVGRLKVLDTGWYCDSSYTETLNGLILALPHGQFLAGWTLGKDMISFVEKHIFDSKESAERYADTLAEKAADNW